MPVNFLSSSENVVAETAPLTNGIANAANSATNQLKVTLHVGDTLGLNPIPADCQQNATAVTAPNTPVYLFSSRNSYVCTCSTTPNQWAASCTILAKNVGQTECVIVSGRTVNASFSSATPAAVAGGATCSLLVQVVA